VTICAERIFSKNRRAEGETRLSGPGIGSENTNEAQWEEMERSVVTSKESPLRERERWREEDRRLTKRDGRIGRDGDWKELWKGSGSAVGYEADDWIKLGNGDTLFVRRWTTDNHLKMLSVGRWTRDVDCWQEKKRNKKN
jgi:hypothetical protein